MTSRTMAMGLLATIAVGNAMANEASTRDPEQDRRFRAGIDALEAGDCKSAITTFDEMLAIDPSWPRVRLELALAHYACGNDRRATAEFERVMAAELPEQVFANVRTFLDEIRRRRGWDLRIGTSFEFDTNPGSATHDDTLWLFGVPFDYTTKRGPKAVGTHWVEGGVQRPISNRLTVLANARVERRNVENRDYDMNNTAARGGARFLLTPRADVTWMVTGNREWEDGIGTNHWGTRFQARQRFDRASIDANLAWGRSRPTGWKVPDRTREASAGVQWSMSPTRLLLAGIGYGKREDQRRRWIRAGIAEQAPHGISVSISARLEQMRKHGTFPFIEPGKEHRDVIRSLDMTVWHRTLEVLGFSPALTVWYGEQASNAQLQDYKRLRFGIRFTRDL